MIFEGQQILGKKKEAHGSSSSSPLSRSSHSEQYIYWVSSLCVCNDIASGIWTKWKKHQEESWRMQESFNKNLNVLRRERKHCLFWYCFPLFFTPWVFYILVPWFLLLTIQSFNFILIYLNLKLKKCSAPLFWWDLRAHLNGQFVLPIDLFKLVLFGIWLGFFFLISLIRESCNIKENL